ncbi:DUF6422 family protein [Ochrobactrum sp. SFR4]|uniref:DUF6422 family protein n=1 Tax=Ochrobactrum sp. SFR4 TaxID=2717368 RepID=UPI003369D5BD
MIRVETQQAVIGVAEDFTGGELEGFRRIQRNHVIECPAENQRIGRCCGLHCCCADKYAQSGGGCEITKTI